MHPSVFVSVCEQYNIIMGHQGHILTKKRDHLSRKQDKNVDQVQAEPAGSGVVQFNSSNYVAFKSRESTFNGILEALQDDKISCVAIYGVSGTGKTTLAKYIGRRARELNIFNIVLFLFVRYPPRVKKIQGDIAGQLGLILGEEDDLAARQQQISLRLRNERCVLIILDNIWERLHLQEIGIVNDGSHMGCKVLLTTRSQQVAYLMGCQLNFPLYLLADQEAFHLFRKHVGIYDGFPPDLTVLAKKVSESCQGLPLKISVIGSTLRGKSVDQWRKLLGTSPEYNSSLTVFPSLLLSYNAISSKVAKTVFLICGLFPKGHEILIEDLSQYAIRLGLCSKNEVSAVINTLKDYRLLMHSDKSKDHVKMHDLVHEMAVTMVYSEKLTYADSINEYMSAMFHGEDFQWHEDLDRLLRQLYGVHEQHPSSSTSNSAPFDGDGGGGEGHELQVVRSYSHSKAATIPKPSGKLVHFYGLCQVDKSFLPLLKEACAMKPQLIESQRRHSEMLRQSAFECLGRVLFLLHNVRNRDWVYHKDELEMFWEQLNVFKFDLGWLCPVMEGVLSSAEVARIEALQEEENYWNKEAAKLREQLKIVENKATVVRTEIALTESKLDGFPLLKL